MSTARVRRPNTARLGRHSNGMLMTPEEFDAATDFDELYSYELIHGVLIVSPPPGESERDPNGELEYLLRAYQSGHQAGSALDKTLSEQYVHLADSRRRADRVIWAGLGRIPDPKTDIPAIVVEFVSNRHRDRVRDYEEKRREYLAIGVLEYWVIDRFRRIMTVCRGRPGPGEPAEQVIKENEVYRTPLLTGFELPLARLLKVADDWAGPVRARKNSGSTRGSAPQ
ncbi:MAG: Uma2 family endonuclease [Isosphaeraceae bacterium]